MHSSPLFVTLEDSRALIRVEDVLEIVEDVFRMQANGEVTWAQPSRFTLHGRAERIYSHVKGCILEPVPVMGVRVVGYHIEPDGSGTSSADSTRLVVLTEPQTGRLLAIVDEHWTYSARTTAAAVVGAKYTARRDSRVAGIVGAGHLARSGLAALAQVFPLAQVNVTSRRRESYEAFAAEMAAELGLPVRGCASVEEVCRGADVILISTTASHPVVMEPWVRPGACLISLGANEVEAALYSKVDRLVVDDVAEVGRLLHRLLGEGVIADHRMEEIHELVAGRRPGRARPDERVLVKTVGLVSQDVAVAYQTYRRAQERGMGIPLAGTPARKD